MTPGSLGISEQGIRALQGVTILSICMTWLTSLTRFYTRAWLVRSPGWDDLAMVGCMAVFTGGAICTLMMCNAVLELLTVESISNLMSSFHWLRRVAPQYILAFMAVKLSLLLFFLRMNLSRWVRWTMIVTYMIYFALSLAYILITMHFCGSFTDITLILINYTTGRCMKWRTTGPLNYTFAVMNTVTDAMYVCLPMYLLLKSNMPHRQKIVAIGIINLGLFSTLCSVVRLAFIEGFNLEQYIFPSTAILLTSYLELGIGITAANLATFKPLISSWRTKAKASKSSAQAATTKDETKTGIQVIAGVGVLSSFMNKTGMSTVTSAIFRRIRQEDFAVFATRDDPNRSEVQHTFDEERQFGSRLTRENSAGVKRQVSVNEMPHEISDRLSVRTFEQLVPPPARGASSGS